MLPIVLITSPPSGCVLHTSSACARTCRCHSIASARAIACVVDGLLLLQTLRTAWVQCWRQGRAWRGTIKRLPACACACSWFNAGPLGFARIFRAKIVIVCTCAICLKLLCSTRYALAAAQGLAPAMFNLAAMHEPPPFPALTSPIYLNDANACMFQCHTNTCYKCSRCCGRAARSLARHSAPRDSFTLVTHNITCSHCWRSIRSMYHDAARIRC